MQAVSTDQRIQTLDVTRGMAVLGILVFNIRFFASSMHTSQWPASLWPAWWDRLAESLIDVLVAGKFLSIFAILFGYGTVIMQDRARAAGRPFARVYARRLAALAAFGLVHGLLIWFGDILFHYAVVGVALLLFRNKEPRALLTWSVALMSLLWIVVFLSEVSGADPLRDPEMKTWVWKRIVYDHLVYSSGTFAEIHQVRVMDWTTSVLNHLVFYPQILGLFLLGAYLARRRLLHDVRANRAALAKLALWTGGAGLALTAVSGPLPDLSYVAGGPVIGLFYVAVLGLLMGDPAWERRLQPLAFVGRTAFTNYIMQSVVCTLIFYGYGLGLYGRLGPLATTGLALALYTVQVFVSRAWLHRFRMGPLEWVWRVLTYLSVPGKARAAS